MNKNKMHSILRKIVSFLESKDISYWIDSGTLLGFAREGDFIEWDDDVDIAALYKSFTDKKDMDKLSLLLNDEGYTSCTLYYKNKAYLIKFMPLADTDSLANVSIFLFREEQNILWTPGWSVRGKDYPLFDPRYYLFGLSRYFLDKIGLHNRIGKYLVDDKDINSLACRLSGKIATMVYPKKLIGTPMSAKWAPGRVPRYWKEYLSYRYGNWNIPVRNWEHSRDDNAYSRCSPEKNIIKLKKKNFRLK